MEKGTIPQKMAELPIEKLPGAAMEYFKRPLEAQSKVLAEILESAKDTEIGRKYGFGDIKSQEEFAERVPLSSWYDYEKYTERMEKGEENILFAGKPEYFIVTSGTTGKNKLIPESAAGVAGKQAVASLRNALQLRSIMKEKGIAPKDASFWDYGHILTFSSSGSLGETSGGIPTGFASGITSGRADERFKRMFCYPPEILNLKEQSAVDYMIMRFALMLDDVIAVVGNNAGRFKVLLDYAKNNAQRLIDEIGAGTLSNDVSLPDGLREKCMELLKPSEKRAKELQAILDCGSEDFIPKNYWKGISLCSFWLGGSVGVYVNEVRPLTPESAIYFDVGYGASEIKINVPTEPGTPYGALGVFAGFFEFLPKDGGAPVFTDGLAEGEIYEIVVTTYSGLYRYKMGDYVQVGGKTAETPNIMFISKTGDTASIANEKVTGELILSAMQKAASELGGSFVFCQVYPCPNDRSYHCFLELSDGAPEAQKLAAAFDARLKEAGEAYRRRRGDGSIREPIVHIMEKGWQQSLYDSKLKPGVSQSQIKLPVVVGEFPSEFSRNGGGFSS